MAAKTQVVFVTVNNQATVKKITQAVLTSRLVACVSEIKNVRATYHWKGKIEKACESLLIMKTRTSLVTKLIEMIKSKHPYEVPEIIALEIKKGNREYLNWIEKETAEKK
ncbi:MAG: divalent-cation tolerance protein CutA [bacterium]